MNRTRAANNVANKHVDKVASPYSPGTTGVAEDRNMIQEAMMAIIEGFGGAGSYTDDSNLFKYLKKGMKEIRKEIGEIFPLLDYKPAVGWISTPGSENPDTYFPAYCISNIATTLTFYKTGGALNCPAFVDYLRAYKATYARGMAGEVSDYSVTNWAIVANVATLTLANNASVNTILAALQEEATANGGFGMAVTVPTIGNVPAGEYAITSIDTVNRYIVFACVAANGSGAVSSTAAVYPFRILASTTTARMFPGQGLTLMAANDANGYFIGGLRRRGFAQGHNHYIKWSGYNDNFSSDGAVNANGAQLPRGAVAGTDYWKATSPINDGTNGNHRTGKETHSPALSVHLFIHVGELK